MQAALGDSISFGRYMNDESLSWDRWSTFSSKRYVEEAKSYAQPGSVAQKKAFFEAHYKKIAAMKAAAALLEQQQQNITNQEPQIASPIRDKEKDHPIGFLPDTPAKQAPPTPPRLENFVTPLSRSSTTTRSVDERRSTSPKPGKGLAAYSTPEKEPDKAKSDSSRVSPLRTPTVVSEKGVLEDASATPEEKRRSRGAIDPPASVSKTAGPKWHLLSSVSKSIKSKLQSPALSKPFNFRTEERAARRKQKLEDKFDGTTAKDAEKVQQQKTTLKEKAGTELRKLRRSLCFSTQLPADYDDDDPETKREKDQVNNTSAKTTLLNEQSAMKGRRKTSSEALLGGTTSVPPVTTSTKNVFRKRG